jgi:hypothetical protein
MFKPPTLPAWCFLRSRVFLFESYDIHRMCADVGMKMMEACLQSDSGRQQNKARSAKLSKRFFVVFV